MNKLLEQLENILNAESDLHCDLLQTAKLLNEAIRSKNLDQIQKHTLTYDELVYKVQNLEEKRIECATDLCIILGIKGEAPKMNSLLEKVSEDWRRKLITVQKTLKNQISELSKINDSNNILLQESILFISKNILMFQQASTRNYRYGEKGKATSSHLGRNLINRVA